MSKGSQDYWYVNGRALLTLLETLHSDLYDSSQAKSRLELAVDQLTLTVLALGDVITALSTEIGDPLKAFLSLTVTTWETEITSSCEQVVSIWSGRTGVRFKAKSTQQPEIYIYESASCSGDITYTLAWGETMISHYTGRITARVSGGTSILEISEW